MTTSQASILVTGATGTVGSHVVDRLAESDVIVRAATRDPNGSRVPDGVEVVRFDFEQPETWGGAFEDVDRVFLVRPPEISNVGEFITPAIDAAARVGVEHVVFLSVLGAERNPLLPHRRIEKHLERSEVNWTALRAGFFMENLLEVHGREIAERGEIIVPAGDGATSFVAAADVAAVAVRCLTEPAHHNRAYDVTGSQALTYADVAAVLSDVLDRDIRYTRPSLVDFVRHSRSIGRPWSLTLVMAGLYTVARLGLAGRISDDCQRLLGRPPTSLHSWAREHRTAFDRCLLDEGR